MRLSEGYEIAFHDTTSENLFQQRYGDGGKAFVKEVLELQAEGLYKVIYTPNLSAHVVEGRFFTQLDDTFTLVPEAGDCAAEHNELIIPILRKIITARILYIFDDFGGTNDEYLWLRKTYGVTEDEDNRWLDICYNLDGTLTESSDFVGLEKDVKQDILEFVTDKQQVKTFLLRLHDKYFSSNEKYKVS